MKKCIAIIAALILTSSLDAQIAVSGAGQSKTNAAGTVRSATGARNSSTGQSTGLNQGTAVGGISGSASSTKIDPSSSAVRPSADTTTSAGSRIGTSIAPEDSAARTKDLNSRAESPARQGLTNSVLVATNSAAALTNRTRIAPVVPVPPAPAVSPSIPAIVPGVGTF